MKKKAYGFPTYVSFTNHVQSWYLPCLLGTSVTHKASFINLVLSVFKDLYGYRVFKYNKFCYGSSVVIHVNMNLLVYN